MNVQLFNIFMTEISGFSDCEGIKVYDGFEEAQLCFHYLAQRADWPTITTISLARIVTRNQFNQFQFEKYIIKGQKFNLIVNFLQTPNPAASDGYLLSGIK